jgi:23S rRNA (adenine2503-C2)-methyltransferase
MEAPKAILRTVETPTVMASSIDRSVNFIRTGSFPGYLESRFVRRPGADHFTCYLSVQTGCRQGCRMCHLTVTRQTQTENAFAPEILQQAQTVLAHYDERIKAGDEPVAAVHYSFMARGEPLASENFLDGGDRIMQMLAEEAVQRNLIPRFLISTIMPKTLPRALAARRGTLAAQFRLTQPFLYYSIYTTMESFRQRWLPAALPVEEALKILKRYQDETGRIVKLHWAFIKDENDSATDVGLIMDAVDAAGLRVDVNLVRYNPPEAGSAESGEHVYKAAQDDMLRRWPQARVKVVPRVGYDVYASCGMFVGGS